jgi:hypothetical protein
MKEREEETVVNKNFDPMVHLLRNMRYRNIDRTGELHFQSAPYARLSLKTDDEGISIQRTPARQSNDT